MFQSCRSGASWYNLLYICWFNDALVHLFLCAALPLPSASVDAVVCDLPFGRKFGSKTDMASKLPLIVAEMERLASFFVIHHQIHQYTVFKVSQASCRRLQSTTEPPLQWVRKRLYQFYSHPTSNSGFKISLKRFLFFRILRVNGTLVLLLSPQLSSLLRKLLQKRDTGTSATNQEAPGRETFQVHQGIESPHSQEASSHPGLQQGPSPVHDSLEHQETLRVSLGAIDGLIHKYIKRKNWPKKANFKCSCKVTFMFQNQNN